jgi:hypothetical protein
MRTALALQELRTLRDAPMWMLLAARQSELIVALLQSLFPEASTKLGPD